MADSKIFQPLARPINPNAVTCTLESSIANSVEILSRSFVGTTGFVYIFNLYLNTLTTISTGESKWLVLNPISKSNMSGIVLSPNDTTQYGVFSVMSNGNVWVRITNEISSGKQITLSATGLAN